MLGPQTLDTTRDYLLTLSHPDERQSLAGVFTGDETMEGTIWAGEDQAELASFSAGWAGSIDGNPTSLPNPVVGMTVTAGAISSLSPGVYEFRVTIPETATEIYRGQIDLRAGPGTATAPSTYCSVKALLDVAPEIANLQAVNDTAGFADQRQTARDMFDALLQSHYRAGGANTQTTLDHLLDGGTSFRTGANDATLQAWLDDDRLVLTTPDGRMIVRWNALTTAWLILKREMGGRGEEYRDRARSYKREADALAACITAEIDTTTTADGVGDIYISLACHDTLRG
jgi:hypothetical protein